MSSKPVYLPVFFSSDFSGGWYSHVRLLQEASEKVGPACCFGLKTKVTILRCVIRVLLNRVARKDVPVIYFPVSYGKENLLALGCRLLRFKYVTRVSGKELQSGKGLSRLIRKQAFLGARALLVLQEEDKDTAIRQWGLPPCKVIVFPNASRDMRGPRLVLKQPKKERTLEWLFCGVLSAAKNIEFLIDAIRLANIESGPCINHRLTLVGAVRPKDQAWYQALRTQIANDRDLARHITFAGPQESCQEFYSRASGYLFAAKTGGMSNAVLEALSAELPVVMCDGPMAKAIFGDKLSLFTIAENNASAMARAMNEVARDQGRYKEVSEAARELWETRYSPEKLAARLERLRLGS